MTLDALRDWGADVDTGLSRCMNNEDFYLRMVDRAKGEEGFATLPAAIAEGRLHDAFEAAHSLKGVLGNLALTPLFAPVSEITELLRSETDTDYSALLPQIAHEHDRLCAL
jgi:HPt (histidine-containing phosphotransfer) domain-containing protein